MKDLPPRWRILYALLVVLVFGVIINAIPVVVQVIRQGEVNTWLVKLPRIPTAAEANCANQMKNWAQIKKSISVLDSFDNALYNKELAELQLRRAQWIASGRDPHADTPGLLAAMGAQQATVSKHKQAISDKIDNINTLLQQIVTTCHLGPQA
ncbi:MAG: hypothetical protein AB7H71_04630 [Alphaproteobacteria bacterium]